jgi:hypothetical protein
MNFMSATERSGQKNNPEKWNSGLFLFDFGADRHTTPDILNTISRIADPITMSRPMKLFDMPSSLPSLCE